MLKFKITKEQFDALSDAHKALYKQEGDSYILQVEGAVARERLDEFRDTNVNLQKELKELKTKYDGIDVDKYVDLTKRENDLINGKLKDGKTIEQVVTERTETMRLDYEKKIKEANEGIARRDGELARLKISDAAIAAASKKGLRPTAQEDLRFRAANVFRLDEKGNPVAYDGDKPIYGKTGDPLSFDEWADQMIEKAPHLFEPSNGTGAGAGGGGGGGAGNTINPWKAESWNMTKQAEIYRKDPKLAATLAAAAGKKLNVRPAA